MRTFSIIVILAFSFYNPICAQTARNVIVFLNSNSEAAHSKEEVEKIMQGHTEVREKLAKEGKLLAAGPFETGGGIYILNTSSEEEARKWLSEDPGIQKKRWLIEVYPYLPRHGGICPVGEKYTMTNYSFVRFDAIVSKSTAQSAPDLMRLHDDFVESIVKKENVITEATFGNNDGGILILRGEIDREVIESDPAVQQGLIQFQIKNFYTAKGTFCEE